MPKKLVFSTEQLEELKGLLDKGLSQVEIASHFNTTDTMIRKICKENGIELNRISKTYQCVVCGKQFEASYKSSICPECKDTPSICVVCGKEFKRTSPYTQKTCSSKCRGIYRKESGIAQQGATKMKATKIERYGTLDPSAVSKAANGGTLNSKICKWCGKEFIPETTRQVYCSDIHYGSCPVCGKQVEIKDFSIGPQACSEECRLARISATCEERYGSKYAVTSEHAKQAAKERNLEKYGKEHYSQTDEYKEKYKQTSLERYGTENPLQNAEIREKGKQTLQAKYSVDNYMQTEEGKARVKATYEARYGGIGFASSELRSKITATNRMKYGADWSASNPEVRKKIAHTNRARYGVDNFWSSDQDIARRIKDPNKAEAYLEFKQNPVEYVHSHYSDKPPIYVLTRDLGVSDTPVYDILIKNDCKDLIDRTRVSTMEYEMLTFLKSVVPDADIQINNRTAIKPLELDFYLPEYHFAIECNPTLTHNSTINSWDTTQDPLPYNYHKIKSLRAESEGIFLMHIFGHEWEHKRPILKSMISNALHSIAHKMYARNTTVVDVPYRDAAQFLDSNHRQGNASSSIRLGLVDNQTNELVSLMTFGKARPAMGRLGNDPNDTVELIRFCSKLNTTVVGGASKLFSYFTKTYLPEKVISFSDLAHAQGKLYSTLCFKKVSLSDPGYCWVKPYGEVFRSRVSCQKHNLVTMFDDVDEDTIKEKSEREIMIAHGYLQVYDSGVVRWEWQPGK